jgi:hypothetical protein
MHLAVGDRAAAIALMTKTLQDSDVVTGGWFAFAVAAGLESEFRTVRAEKRRGS